MTRDLFLEDEEATRALGAELARSAKPGDIFLLFGELGAGKTTLVRGLLQALGHEDPVRSPTFNLVQVFPTAPPIMHADLYRVKSYEGIGLEDYLDTHVCLIEWPDRAEGLVDFDRCFVIKLQPEKDGRRVTVRPPTS